MNIFTLKSIFIAALTIVFLSCNSDKTTASKIVVEDSTHTVSGKAISKELVELNEKVKTSINNPAPFTNRANYLIKQKEFDAALQDINSAYSLDSNYIPLYLTLCDYHLYKGEPAQARSVLEKGLKQNPKAYMIHVKLGELYYLAKQYDLSFTSLNEGLKINKYYADGYFWKGMIYKDKGDDVNAMSNFQTSVEQDPENFKAYMQMGLMSLQSMKPEAADYFTSAIRVDPKNLEAYYGRAYYYQLKKDYDKSIQDYTEMIRIDSTYAIAHYNLGVLHYELRITDVAFKNFSKAIQFNTKYAEAYYMRGLCHEAKSRDKEALLDFEFALSLRPGYPLALKGIDRVQKTIKILENK